MDLALLLIANIVDLVKCNKVIAADADGVLLIAEPGWSSAERNVVSIVTLGLVLLVSLRVAVLTFLLDHVIGLHNILILVRVVLLFDDFVADVGGVVELIVRGVIVAVVGLGGWGVLLLGDRRLDVGGLVLPRAGCGAGGFLVFFLGRCRVFGFLLLLLEKGLKSLFLLSFRHV